MIRATMPSKDGGTPPPPGQPDSPPVLALQDWTGLPEGFNHAEQPADGPPRAAGTHPIVHAHPLPKPALKDGNERRLAPRPRADGGLGAFSIGAIRGEIEAKFADIIEMRKGQFRAQIYPSGVLLKSLLGYSPEPPATPQRGDIEGFSNKASRRLREFWMSAHVPGYDLWSVTLTTHKIFTAEQWRAIVMRFRQAVIYANYAGVWRVELQRRKTPHLHVGFWLPASASLANVESLWLKATGEQNDPAAQEHAVVGRKIEQNESGWAVYMAMHDGKHKAEQLGWKGKQWGVWNRAAYSHREPETVVLSEKEHGFFLALLALHDREQKAAQFVQKINQQTGNDHQTLGIEPEHFPLREMHRGNLLWCIDGKKVAELIQRAKLLAAEPS